MRSYLLVGVALATVGCISIQPSVQPWLAPQDAVAVPAIEGTWIEEDRDPMELRIARLAGDAESGKDDDGPAYVLTVLKKGRPVQGALIVTLGRLDGALYWDLTPLPIDDTADLWDEHVLGLHSLARVDVEGSRLEVAPLDPEWIKGALEDDFVQASHLLLDDWAVLTGTTADLQALVIEHAADDEAFTKPITFARRATPSAAE